MAAFGILKRYLIRLKSTIVGAPKIRDLLLFPLLDKRQRELSTVHIIID